MSSLQDMLQMNASTSFGFCLTKHVSLCPYTACDVPALLFLHCADFSSHRQTPVQRGSACSLAYCARRATT